MTFRFTLAISTAALIGAAPLLAHAHEHPAQDQNPHGHHAAGQVHKAAMTGTKGQSHGTASLEQTSAGVLVSVDLTGLPEGELGFPIHEKGLCEAGQAFASAGGHFAPTAKVHGFRAAKDPHAGDIPNIHVGPDGKARMQILNSAVTLDGGKSGLMDADGSAFVIHAAADDYVSQPAGASGARIVCGVIAPPKSR